MTITFSLLKNDTPCIFQAELIKSDRRTIGITIKPGGDILIRAPKHMSNARIQSFLQLKKDWILKTQEKLSKQTPLPSDVPKTPQVLALEKRYREAAREYIPKRVAYYHTLTGGSYTKITIRDQKTRWGSCSGSGTLSFNFRLMLAPPRVLDYVVVHELCHLTHMDHSKEFWDMVERILPDYKELRKWLKENGHTLRIEYL